MTETFLNLSFFLCSLSIGQKVYSFLVFYCNLRMMMKTMIKNDYRLFDPLFLLLYCIHNNKLGNAIFMMLSTASKCGCIVLFFFFFVMFIRHFLTALFYLDDRHF